MRVSFPDVGQFGLISDLPAHELPFGAFSDGKNVRFFDGKVLKFTGSLEPFGTPVVPPYWLLTVPTTDLYFWLYAGLQSVTAYNGGIHSDITRLSGPYTGGESDLWNGGLLSGVPVLNNGVDVPQAWNPPLISQKLVDLPNWPANTRARVVRPFKEFLVALDVTKAGIRFPHMVKWSHPADPGTLPNSWDEEDPTKDAGEKDLTDTEMGFVQDCLPLRNINIIYKEGSAWAMQHIGGTFIFRFYTLFENMGILCQRAVASVDEGASHFLATADDLVVHDGNNVVSLLDRRKKRWLSNLLSGVAFRTSFCIKNSIEDEYWFCFPEHGSLRPNRAIVWNKRYNTLGDRELPLPAFIANGVVEDPSGLTWDSDSGTWDSDGSAWGERLYGFRGSPVAALPDAQRIYQMDQTNTDNGATFLSFIERTGMPLGFSKNGERVINFDRFKMVSRVWPRIIGGPVKIRVGSQKIVDGPITWSDFKIFDPSTQEKVDFLGQGGYVPGRLVCIRFETDTDTFWELKGYDIELDYMGGF